MCKFVQKWVSWFKNVFRKLFLKHFCSKTNKLNGIFVIIIDCSWRHRKCILIGIVTEVNLLQKHFVLMNINVFLNTTERFKK
jgi:hypothetical protein